MKQFTLIAIIISMSIFISCCSNNVEPTRKLVVEGWIESGEHPVVILTVPYRPGSDNSVEELLARPANVKLSDGETTWQLTGMYNPGYFPPYVYTNFEMRGEVGKSYTLTILYDGLRASAQTEILPSPVIDDIKIVPDAKKEDLSEVEILTTPTAECSGDEYLMAFVKIAAGGKRILPCYMGTYRIECGGASQAITVKRPKHKLDTIQYYSNFKKGEEIEVHLCRLTRDSYEFWIDFQNAISVGNSNIITGSYSLRTNMTGDATGYFFGYGSDSRTIIIP